MQKEGFFMTRDRMMKGLNGNDSAQPVPNQEGWIPWGYIKDHLMHRDVIGTNVYSDANLWQVLIHTVHNKDPTHATYMVVDMEYVEVNNGVSTTNRFIMIKLRNLPAWLRPSKRPSNWDNQGGDKHGKWGHHR